MSLYWLFGALITSIIGSIHTSYLHDKNLTKDLSTIGFIYGIFVGILINVGLRG